jgi:hypothetical protein
MARTLEALNALNMAVKIFTGGQARVGIGIGGTWSGQLNFYQAFDAVNYLGYPLTVQPFPSGAGVQFVTANGNFWADISNALGVAVVMSGYVSGAANVIISAANDGSWQDAFLAATSLNVSQNVAGGLVNSQVIAAQANRAWRLRSASVSFSVAPSVAIEFQVLDGASSVLWDGYISGADAVAPGVFPIPLPPPDPAVPGSGGVVGTPGNSMTLKLFAPGGGVISTVNGELHAA